MLVWNEFVNDARVLKEAQTLAAAGHQVVVHALHTPGKTQEKEDLQPGIQVVRVARSPWWRLRKKKHAAQGQGQPGAATAPKSLQPHRQLLRLVARVWTHWGLAWRLMRSGADVIHAHDVNVLPTAWLAARVRRVPLVYDAHEISTDREGYQAFRKWVGWIEKKIMPGVVASITTTDMRAKFFARAYGIERPLVLQNRPRWQARQASDQLRARLQLKEPWPIILYQGGLQQGRGLPRLLEAAAQVQKAYFVFVGGGRQEAELYDQAQGLQLGDRVHFIPTVSLAELPSLTASADIGVQPIENTCLNHLTTDSNKLFEYVMAGLPVVASNLPEIRKVVESHDLGLLVEPGNTGALVAALQVLVTNEDRRSYYAHQAVKAAKQLSWEEQEFLLVDLYERILNAD